MKPGAAPTNAPINADQRTAISLFGLLGPIDFCRLAYIDFCNTVSGRHPGLGRDAEPLGALFAPRGWPRARARGGRRKVG